MSSLGGTNHVWASYYMETMGLDEKVTWIGTGNVDTMLGSLKTKQVDVLVSSLSLLNESTEQGWGTLLFDGTDEAIWNKYIGGKVPVTAHFTVQSTIDKDPPKMQAFVTALWRATQWIKAHSPDEVYDMIEPYVGSTSRGANILEITALKKVADYDGVDRCGELRPRRKGLVPRNDRHQAADDCRGRQSGFHRSRAKSLPGLKIVKRATRAQRCPQRRRSIPDVHRIDVRGLNKTFQLAGTAIEAVRNVSFNVRRGEFVALLGPSGSGKSTVLNMIATLIRPSSGQILIDGTPIVAGKATPNVGYVFQRDTLFPWRTVADNIGYGLQLAGVPKPSARSASRPASRRQACAASSRPIPRRCPAACASAPR